MSVVVDAYVGGLRDGEAEDTFGLNVNVASPPPEELRVREAYEAWKAGVDAVGSSTYTYPFSSLHVTLFTFLPFPSTPAGFVSDLAWQERVGMACGRVMDRVVEEGDGEGGKWREWLEGGWEMRWDRVEVGRNGDGEVTALILRVEDVEGVGDRVRERIWEKLREKEGMEEFVGKGGERGWAKAPSKGFFHSTIARFPEKIEKDTLDAVLTAATSKWTPTTISKTGPVRLVAETKPYMHVDILKNTIWPKPKSTHHPSTTSTSAGAGE